jgi:hypothetical protein
MFSRPSQPKLFINDSFLAKVSDAGTSTDDASLDQIPPDTTVDDQTFSPQQPSLIKRQSSGTSQSSRTESETYTLNKPNGDQENYEQLDTDPLPTVKSPGSLSPVATPTTHPYSNVRETNTYESDDTDINQSTEQPYQNETIERLRRPSPPMDPSPSPSTTKTSIDDRINETSRSGVSMTSAKASRGIWDLLFSRKTKGKPKKDEKKRRND